jgi:hypothetical protein
MPPITPREVSSQKVTSIPEFVFETVNALIVKKFAGSKAVVYQDEILTALEFLGHNRSFIFAECWLNFESAYQKIGWSVTYDKPAYNESGRAYFTFTAPR